MYFYWSITVVSIYNHLEAGLSEDSSLVVSCVLPVLLSCYSCNMTLWENNHGYVPITLWQELKGSVQVIDMCYSQGNKLEVLPTSWKDMRSLKQFSLADNRLEVLPDSIAELQMLETLWMWVSASHFGVHQLCGMDSMHLRFFRSTIWVWNVSEGYTYVMSKLMPWLTFVWS